MRPSLSAVFAMSLATFLSDPTAAFALSPAAESPQGMCCRRMRDMTPNEDGSEARDDREGSARLQIALRSQPDPPRAGENKFEVTVKGRSGTPVTDADVSIVFYMPGMPSMNMPEMRNDVKLQSTGNGVYRGTGNVAMAGRWEVTVVVSRSGQRLGSRRLTAVVR